MATGQECRDRLVQTNARLDEATKKAEELATHTERTKVRLVEAANGTYVRLKEMLDGSRDKG